MHVHRHCAVGAAEDAALLHRLQAGVPLVPRPFDVIADETGLPVERVLERLVALRGPGRLIRELSAIFNVRALGYEQALVALKVRPEGLDAAGAKVSAHPGVSHCYSRTADYNLWFTLASSPHSQLGLHRTVERLAGKTGAQSHMVLPTLTQYKLSTQFRLDGATASVAEAEPSTLRSSPVPSGPAPTVDEVRAIQALQLDLPALREPFHTLADWAGLWAPELLAIAEAMRQRGWLRRYAAVLYHRAAGAKANVMVVWKVPEDQADVAGQACATSPAVSHCYLRPTCPDWPYSLYTMVHGQSAADCEQAVSDLERRSGLRERLTLWTQREYAKRRVRLFDAAEARWESRPNCAASGAAVSGVSPIDYVSE